MDPENDNMNDAATHDAAAPSDVVPAEAGTSSPVEAPAADDKAAEYLAGWKRAQADYANLKRESEARVADIARHAAGAFVEQMLPIIDGFEKAHAAYPDESDAAKLAQWAAGIGLIKLQLDTLLARAGVTRIAESGVPFDPSFHEAMLQKPADDAHPTGTVLEVLEPGYRMGERVLRPAKVTVAE